MSEHEAFDAGVRAGELGIDVADYPLWWDSDMREAWNDWTDGLCKNGQITQRQYERWLMPRS